MNMEGEEGPAAEAALRKATKKVKKRSKDDSTRGTKKPRTKPASRRNNAADLSSQEQEQVNAQMRKALEEDQYSAHGSIVDTDSDEDDTYYMYRGHPVRLDRSALLKAVRKQSRRGGVTPSASSLQEDYQDEEDQDEEDVAEDQVSSGKQFGKKQRRDEDRASSTSEDLKGALSRGDSGMNMTSHGSDLLLDTPEDDLLHDGGSIFGQTAGSSSNSTWVECDKCKKWRRLRGVVDEKKLPSKWYCSMNKNDPERAHCRAPEEEYETPHTPESAADARVRKHLRVWVRRLQCNEAYEARQPTLTRGKKRAAATSSKDPYEWVRCCNPSCGKWRAILRIMDAKTQVIDRTTDGEWYCVMNTWDEKTASCAAPQENLPAIGCPPWVIQDDN